MGSPALKSNAAIWQSHHPITRFPDSQIQITQSRCARPAVSRFWGNDMRTRHVITSLTLAVGLAAALPGLVVLAQRGGAAQPRAPAERELAIR